MCDPYSRESVFKKPAIPSRYQRTHSFNRAGSAISNTSEYSSNTVKEKIEILEKVFPQNDDIWENLVKNIDHLCFVKVSESVLQQNSQRSLINNANAYPDISPRHTSSNFRFNCTQSTNNVPDFISQPHQQNIISAPVPPESQYRNSRTRNVCTTSVPGRSQETDSRNIVSGLQYTSQDRVVQNETLLETRNSRTRTKSPRTNNESTVENDSSLASESYASNTSEQNVVSPTQKETTTNERSETRSKINNRRSQCEESSDLEKQKRPKKNEAVKESTQHASSTSANCKRLVRQKNNNAPKNNLDLSEFDNENDSDDSLAAFFQKRRKLNLKKSSSVVATDSSQSSQDTVIETRDTRKPSTTRKTKKTASAQSRGIAKSTNTKAQFRLSSEDSEDVSSQSEECSNIQIINAKKPSKTRTTQVRKTSRAEKVITKVKTTQNSPSCEERSELDEPDAPTRERNRQKKDTKRAVKTTVVRKTQYEEDSVSSEVTQSQESIVYETKNTKKSTNTKNTNRMKRVPAKKPESTVNRKKTAAVDQVGSSRVAQKKKTLAPSQAENKIVSNPSNKLENNVDASFFGNVSAILANKSVSLVCSENGMKSKNRPTREPDTSMHFFSPFASANLRSTSGFSAISTPLSKSVAKNVLGKRVKKPNVGAELRNELKEQSKKRKTKKNPHVIQPVHEITATSESECEASDFSDMD